MAVGSGDKVHPPIPPAKVSVRAARTATRHTQQHARRGPGSEDHLRGRKLGLSVTQRAAAPPPPSDPRKPEVARPRFLRPRASGFLSSPLPAPLLPPPCEGAAPGSPEVRAWAAGRSRPLHPARPHAPPPPQPTGAAHLSWRTRAKAHLGGRSLRSSQAWHPPATTSGASGQGGGRPPPAAAPSPPPLPAPRPARPPPASATAGPARNTSESPHASHSLSREASPPLARRTPRPSPRKKWVGLLNGREGTGKSLPTCSGAASRMAARVTWPRPAAFPLVRVRLAHGSFKLEADLRTSRRRLARFLVRYLGNRLTLSSGKISKPWLALRFGCKGPASFPSSPRFYRRRSAGLLLRPRLACTCFWFRGPLPIAAAPRDPMALEGLILWHSSAPSPLHFPEDHSQRSRPTAPCRPQQLASRDLQALVLTFPSWGGVRIGK